MSLQRSILTDLCPSFIFPISWCTSRGWLSRYDIFRGSAIVCVLSIFTDRGPELRYHGAVTYATCNERSLWSARRMTDVPNSAEVTIECMFTHVGRLKRSKPSTAQEHMAKCPQRSVRARRSVSR